MMNNPAPRFDITIESTLDKPCGIPELDALFRKGKALMKQKKYDQAAEIFRDIMKKKPDHFAAIEQMGIIARELGQHEKSLLFFQALTEHVVTYAPGYAHTGAALMELERHEEAVSYMEKALPLGNHHYLHIGLGNCYALMGKNDFAKEHFFRALEMKYDLPEMLHTYLFSYHKFKSSDDPHLQHVLQLLRKNKKMPPRDVAYLHTILYKAYDDLGEHDRAMEHAIIAGHIRKQENGYNAKANIRILDALKTNFSANSFSAEKTSGNSSRLPVFILAMPRSGTTLLEQILHSHPDITGIGEDLHFGKTIQDRSRLPNGGGVRGVLSNSTIDITEVAKVHLAYLEQKAKGAKRIVDKAIVHYYWVGLLYQAFPDAHFIHLTRDPLSSAISAFVRTFENDAQPYTNDLADIGQAWRQHYEIMEFWKSIIPARILDVSYESIVENMEDEAHRVIDFLGLPWSDNCLEFYKTKKIVKTASIQQVRKPIYKDSLETWRKYEKHLAPLVEALGPYAPPESLYILEKYGNKNLEKTGS